MYRNRVLMLVSVVAGLALLASCGSEAEALSKSEFVDQGNMICEATNHELEPIFTRLWEGPDLVDFVDPDTQDQAIILMGEVMGEAFPLWQQQLTDLKALAPPKEDKELLDELFVDFETAVDEMRQLIDEAVVDAAGARELLLATLEGDEDPLAGVNRRASEYGLSACGEDE